MGSGGVHAGFGIDSACVGARAQCGLDVRLKCVDTFGRFARPCTWASPDACVSFALFCAVLNRCWSVFPYLSRAAMSGDADNVTMWASLMGMRCCAACFVCVYVCACMCVCVCVCVCVCALFMCVLFLCERVHASADWSVHVYEIVYVCE